MKNALRCYKFLYDMWDAISNMHKVLRSKGKCIIIIGNNNFKVKGEKREFRNGDFLEEIALNKEIGFSKWQEKPPPPADTFQVARDGGKPRRSGALMLWVSSTCGGIHPLPFQP